MISIDWQDEQHPEKLCCKVSNQSILSPSFGYLSPKPPLQTLCHKFLLYRAMETNLWDHFVAKKFGLVKYRHCKIISNA